eukprot:GILK01007161.1.p1 GENE.GILK01007161.1~~GILK01007161.1.p1  ORF type:complete len:362 (+),score=25.88 GILK01007161.1:119-1204(+)
MTHITKLAHIPTHDYPNEGPTSPLSQKVATPRLDQFLQTSNWAKRATTSGVIARSQTPPSLLPSVRSAPAAAPPNGSEDAVYARAWTAPVAPTRVRGTMSTSRVQSPRKVDSHNFNPYASIRPSAMFLERDRGEKEVRVIDCSPEPMMLLDWQNRVSFPETQRSSNGSSVKSTPELVLLDSDASLTHPHQRRAELDRIKTAQAEFFTHRRKEALTNKQTKLLQSSYRNGALGFDSPLNPNSDIYHEHAVRLEKQRKRKELVTLARRQVIDQKTTSSGFEFNSERARQAGHREPPVLSSPTGGKRSPDRTRFYNTYDRLYGTEGTNTFNIHRAVELSHRNGHRGFDIITGTKQTITVGGHVL